MKLFWLSVLQLLMLLAYMEVCWGKPISAMKVSVLNGHGENEIRLSIYEGVGKPFKCNLVHGFIVNIEQRNVTNDFICNGMCSAYAEIRKNVSIFLQDEGALYSGSGYLNAHEEIKVKGNTHKPLVAPNATIVVNGSPALLVVTVFLGILLLIFALLLALMCKKDENHNCEESVRYARIIKPI